MRIRVEDRRMMEIKGTNPTPKVPFSADLPLYCWSVWRVRELLERMA